MRDILKEEYHLECLLIWSGLVTQIQGEEDSITDKVPLSAQ